MLRINNEEDTRPYQKEVEKLQRRLDVPPEIRKEAENYQKELKEYASRKRDYGGILFLQPPESLVPYLDPENIGIPKVEPAVAESKKKGTPLVLIEEEPEMKRRSKINEWKEKYQKLKEQRNVPARVLKAAQQHDFDLDFVSGSDELFGPEPIPEVPDIITQYLEGKAPPGAPISNDKMGTPIEDLEEPFKEEKQKWSWTEPREITKEEDLKALYKETDRLKEHTDADVKQAALDWRQQLEQAEKDFNPYALFPSATVPPPPEKLLAHLSSPEPTAAALTVSRRRAMQVAHLYRPW